MKATILRTLVLLLLAAGFAALVWYLLDTAPRTARDRPPPPDPMVDVITSEASDHAVSVHAAGTVSSAFELAIRPQVGGQIVEMHPDFEPGGLIPAGSTILRIDPSDYRIEIAAAEAEVAKAQAAKALEQGRRVVAREELSSLGGSLAFDGKSQGLALREPQLRQVQAELAAAQNRVERARLDLERTQLALPYDVIVLERVRVSGEVVAARELVGRVSRADTYWVELRTSPGVLSRLRVRNGDVRGSRVTIRHADTELTGEVVRIRADVASGSRLAGVIVEVPVDAATTGRVLIGSYVEATIDAGSITGAVRVPRRALRDNDRVWVVDGDGLLQVRRASTLWESAQTLLLSPATLRPGDRVVVSRITGLVPGTPARARVVETAENADD